VPFWLPEKRPVKDVKRKTNAEQPSYISDHFWLFLISFCITSPFTTFHKFHNFYSFIILS
jgi:hypothetical protein